MRILAAAIICALAAFFAACYFAGLFDDMTLSTGVRGPYCTVYREHIGPFRQANTVLSDVGGYLADRRIPIPARAFARFLDNPRRVKSQNLRSMVGYITDSLLADVKSPYVAAVIPPVRAVTGVQYARSFLSKYVGPLKFYPRLLRFCKQENLEFNGPVMEIYDASSKKIEYIAPVR
jgi:AraC family transcriptional regulator